MPETPPENQDPRLRQPADENELNRRRIEMQRQQQERLRQRDQVVNTPPIIPPRRRKSALKRAWPWLVAGGSTGIGIGATITDFLT